MKIGDRVFHVVAPKDIGIVKGFLGQWVLVDWGNGKESSAHI